MEDCSGKHIFFDLNVLTDFSIAYSSKNKTSPSNEKSSDKTVGKYNYLPQPKKFCRQVL